MSFERVHRQYLEENLQMVQILALAADELHDNLIDPIDPESRADLLLAAEDLVMEVQRLYKKVYGLVWHSEYSPYTPEQD
jgi:hypothetical protein